LVEETEYQTKTITLFNRRTYTTQKTRDGVLRSSLKTGVSLGVPEVLAIPAL
jgi:uncharacterized protein YqjF (DUF2071 family)